LSPKEPDLGRLDHGLAGKKSLLFGFGLEEPRCDFSFCGFGGSFFFGGSAEARNA